MPRLSVMLVLCLSCSAAGASVAVKHPHRVSQSGALTVLPVWRTSQSGSSHNPCGLIGNRSQASAVLLVVGRASAAPGEKSEPARRNIKIMEISFVKSGGLAGPMTRVQGTVHLNDGGAEVTGDAAYHRQLAPAETEMLRAGADPQSLSQTATRLAAAQSAGRGTGDIEHYTITVKTADGKTHNVTLNAPGGGSDMEAVAPPTAKFLSWLQQESQNILTAKMKAR